MSLFPFGCQDAYWQMWNEPDIARACSFVERAVSDDFEFCDPVNHHVGRAALAANVSEFRTTYPSARVEVASAFDMHHNRVRYRWNLVIDDHVRLQGFDVATIDLEADRLIRVDGFFGPLADRSSE
jgi:hypothetical protein